MFSCRIHSVTPSSREEHCVPRSPSPKPVICINPEEHTLSSIANGYLFQTLCCQASAASYLGVDGRRQSGMDGVGAWGINPGWEESSPLLTMHTDV